MPYKRFSGKRNDTIVVGTKSFSHGFKYYKRRNGSLYPAKTTISVTEPMLAILKVLEQSGLYNNYDEMFVDVIKQVVFKEKPSRNWSFAVSNLTRYSEFEEIKHMLSHSEKNLNLMRDSREKSDLKGRHFSEKTKYRKRFELIAKSLRR